MKTNDFRFHFSLAFLFTRVACFLAIYISYQQGFLGDDGSKALIMSFILIPSLASNYTNLVDSVMHPDSKTFANKDSQVTKTFVLLSFSLLFILLSTIIYTLWEITQETDLDSHKLFLKFSGIEASFSVFLIPILKKIFQRTKNDV